MRQFHNLEEYFNVEMSVPWLMKYLKYCPHQIYELDLIFHISSFTRGLGSFFLSNSPTILFPSSCLSRLVTSCLGGCLSFVYSTVSLVIGAGADMSLGGDSNVTTRYRSRLTITGLLQSLTLCSPLAGVVVSSDQVCSGHTE